MKDELIKNIAGGIDLPKRAFDNAELLLKKLFGSVVEEMGGIMGDAIRSRRFKNQVNIFSKAQELLKSKGLEPKQINLKLLVPLIEYSSLEEDETIQNKWANMIANIATNANEDSFNKKCISILSELSIIEVAILDQLYTEIQETVDEANAAKVNRKTTTTVDNLNLDKFFFMMDKLSIGIPLGKRTRKICTERLLSFRLIKEAEPDIISYPEIQASMLAAMNLPQHRIEPTNKLRVTDFGLYFIKLCKFDK